MAKNALEKYTPSEVGLTLPEDLQFKDWRVLFDGYAHMARSIPWVIGDLLVYGDQHYGEDVGQALDGLMAITQYAQGTIYNLVYVSKNVSPSVRNRNLAHAFHYEVAKMGPGDQMEWLARAEMEGWTTREFRLAIKGKLQDEQVKEDMEVLPPEPINKKTRGEINDPFDIWWSDWSSGLGYGMHEKKVAMAAWNAAAE